MNRPIPAFYCCYLLRSTVRHSCVYVGSTPNPARRLNQHNGVKKGGAAKTSRQHLRPWEMTCIVSGFPSHIAVLQFEWAWQNPHITLHIPSELRIQHATSKKRSGHPKRPKLSVTSLLSNLHLLLRVPSFKRWPLELCFFSQDVYKSWMKLCETSVDLLPEHLSVKTDFPLNDSSAVYNGLEVTKKNSSDHLERLIIDYSNQKSQIEKAKTIIDFEQEKSCSVCKIDLEHGQGIYTICSSPNCKAVTHITCLGRYFQQNDQGSILPVQGLCPVCNSETRWIDVMKELSLRMRGEKELKSLLKVKKIRGSRKASQASSHSLTESSEDSDDKLSDGSTSLPKAKKKRASRKASQASSHSLTESLEDSDDKLSDGSKSLPKAKKKRASRKASQASSQATTESSEDPDDELNDGSTSLPKVKKKRASRKASQASSQATTESSEDHDDELNDGSTSLPKAKKKRASRKASQASSQATTESSEDPNDELNDGSTSLPKAKKKRVSKKASQVTTESAEGPEDPDETNNKNDANSLMSIDNLDGSDTSSLMDCIDISRFPSPTKDHY